MMRLKGRTGRNVDQDATPAVKERSIIAASPLFDKHWYLQRNRDVAAARMDPALHYFLHGAAEGRDPGPRFSTSAYLATNPDVERHGMNPLLHYVLHGAAEGRQISPSIAVAQDWRGAPSHVAPVQTIPSIARKEYEDKLSSEFEAFLASAGRISLTPSNRVCMSIVLVLHNKAHFSYACLKSIEETAGVRKDIEVVIVDSGSTDRTEELLARVDGATKMRLAENEGLVPSVNKAVRGCFGHYIVLLNNDAILKPGALDQALQAIEEDEAIAAVGGKIILPSGVLQEAGCILWSDGTTAGYGRGQPPTAGPYMFRRDVAFCSGTFLMLRRDLFLSLGCLDERFVPAYYEDTDLCVRFRQEGYRVVYDPRVEILHFEFGSAESPEAALRLQARHRDVFVEKHRDFLASCPVHDQANLLNARSVGTTKKRILFLDDHVPYPQLGVGYPRARNVLSTLVKQGHFLTMIPLEYPNDTWESLRHVIPLEVEVMLGVTASDLPSLISDRIGYYDLIFVSRPHNMRTLVSALERQADKRWSVPIVYDAEAIWALREDLQRAVHGEPMSTDEREQTLENEMRLARSASHVIAVNEKEATVFRARGCTSVSVVSHGFRITEASRSHSERRDLLFVGSLDDDPSPNADALIWFVQQIMPLVREGMGKPFRLLVAGRCAAPRVRALAGGDVVVLGQIPDLTGIYNSARVFVAPHRYAGGIPTKILEAAAYGLPCVASDLLASQLSWRHGMELLSAKTADDFARSLVQLYSDESLWSTIRTGALKAMEANYNEQRFQTALASALNSAWSRSGSAR